MLEFWLPLMWQLGAGTFFCLVKMFCCLSVQHGLLLVAAVLPMVPVQQHAPYTTHSASYMRDGLPVPRRSYSQLASSALSQLHLTSVNIKDLDLMGGLWLFSAQSTYRDSHTLPPLSASLAYPVK